MGIKINYLVLFSPEKSQMQCDSWQKSCFTESTDRCGPASWMHDGTQSITRVPRTEVHLRSSPPQWLWCKSLIVSLLLSTGRLWECLYLLSWLPPRGTVRSQVDTRSLGTIDERHHKTTKSYYLKKKKKRASEHEEACKGKAFWKGALWGGNAVAYIPKMRAGHMDIWENPSQLTVRDTLPKA